MVPVAIVIMAMAIPHVVSAVNLDFAEPGSSADNVDKALAEECHITSLSQQYENLFNLKPANKLLASKDKLTAKTSHGMITVTSTLKDNKYVIVNVKTHETVCSINATTQSFK